MDIMSVKEASERWNISERWIQKLMKVLELILEEGK